MHEEDVVFSAGDDGLDLESTSSEGGIPTSVCSMPCKTGEIMIMNTVRRVSLTQAISVVGSLMFFKPYFRKSKVCVCSGHGAVGALLLGELFAGNWDEGGNSGKIKSQCCVWVEGAGGAARRTLF